MPSLASLVPNPVTSALSSAATQRAALEAQIASGSQQLAILTGDQCDLLGTVGGVLDDAAKEALGAAQALTAGTMSALSEVGEKGKSMFDDIEATLAPLADAAEAIYGPIVAAAESAYALLEEGSEAAIAFAQNIANQVSSAMGTVGEYATAAAQAAQDIVANVAGAIGNAVAKINTTINLVVANIGEMIAAVSVASCTAATNVIEGIGDVATAPLKVIQNQATAGLGELPAAGGGDLAAKGSQLISGATGNAQAALDGITNITPPTLPVNVSFA